MNVYEVYQLEPRTIVAGASIDLSADPLKRRIRYITPVGGVASFQGKELLVAATDVVHHSSTGVYTGVDAQCVQLLNTELVNFDKLYVAAGSNPVRVFLAPDTSL